MPDNSLGARAWVEQQFKSNEPFFQVLLSLINASCPIPNVELVWMEPISADQTGCRSLRISETMPDRSPRPFFEDLTPPEAPYVQKGKYGLVSITVPVEARGYRIATLQTAQVLTAPPTEFHLAQIANDASAMDYRKTPVIKPEDLQRTAEMLHVVAGFLAKSLEQTIEAAKEQRIKGRELRMARQEFAYLALDWPESGRGGTNAEEIIALQRRIGFRRSPNRILVVRPEADRGNRKPYLISPLEAVEKLCERLDEVAATRVEMSSICVFLHENAQKLDSRRLAARILHEIREACDSSARIGVGRPKEDWKGLAESYREACLALSRSDQTIAFYQESCGSLDDLSVSVEDLCRSVGENRLEQAGLDVAALPGLVSQHLGARTEDFAFARLFFSFVMESLSAAAQKLGCSGTDLGALCAHAVAEFKRAPSFFQLQAAWLRFAGELLERARQLNSGKRQKIVESACRTIQSGVEQGTNTREVSVSAVAAGLKVSVSHLSRTFKQQTGQTFEQYVITRRVDFAKRLLRDPLNNISEVAAKSGFSDPSYFARVFRKLVGRSPREYCANPQDSGSQALRPGLVETPVLADAPKISAA